MEEEARVGGDVARDRRAIAQIPGDDDGDFVPDLEALQGILEAIDIAVDAAVVVDDGLIPVALIDGLGATGVRRPVAGQVAAVAYLTASFCAGVTVPVPRFCHLM